MKKRTKVPKRLISGLTTFCMVAAAVPFPAASVQAQESRADWNYQWENHDKMIAYPPEYTKAGADASQGSGYDPSKMLDGNVNTTWQAPWNGSKPNPELTLTIEEAEYITGIKYVSRMDNNIDGVMTEYEIYASEDGINYGLKPVSASVMDVSGNGDEAADGDERLYNPGSDVSGNTPAAVSYQGSEQPFAGDISGNSQPGEKGQLPFSSADEAGVTADIVSSPVQAGTLTRKLGTFYIVFDQPVKAKQIKIKSNAQAVSEIRLMYQPSGEADYDKLLADARTLGEEAAGKEGMDIGLWPPVSLTEFQAGMELILSQGRPGNEAGFADALGRLTELISNLKRAQLDSTTALKQQLNYARGMLQAAVVGEKPLMWPQAEIDDFGKLLERVETVGSNPVVGCGALADAVQELEEGNFRFKQAQIKPHITFTGTAQSSMDYMMDQLLETHFRGSGTGENVYLELDYETPLVFKSVQFQTWWATGQCINKIKVAYKDEEGQWKDADGGKEYSINWTTNTSVSETQKIELDTPVKGSALRIYILAAKSFYIIDELTIGMEVSEADVSILLDRDEADLAEGESIQLNATVLPEQTSDKSVTWTSSNPEVAEVKQDGTVTVLKIPEGEESAQVEITATTNYGGKTAVCKVTAKAKLAGEEEKRDNITRLSNAQKLADASKREDYKEGALDRFTGKLGEIRTTLEGDVTVGGLKQLEEEIKKAVTAFEEASLIPVRETKKLIDRITGRGSSDRFLLEMIPADPATGNDVYEVSWDRVSGKPVLRGNDAVSLATAYNYYLKYFAYLDFPYVGDSTLVLPEQMPEVKEAVRIVFPYEYRHYFNENCEYKYTADLYGEEEWQHRIDWMAMNGFNMFLVDLGDHAVWYNAREELGLTDAAIVELRHSSNGTEQYYGKYEISQEAVNQEGELARKVVEMAFLAGMEPEIRPFTGQVPFMFPDQREEYYGSNSKSKMTVTMEGSIFDGVRLYSAARWINLPQGVYISPEVDSTDQAVAAEMKEKFTRISDIYYESLMEVLGFNEYGRTPVFAYKDMVGEQGFVVSHEAFPKEVVRELDQELLKLNPDAVWIQTSWRYYSWLTDYYQPDGLMIVDLSADNRPKWSSTNEFGGTQWLWSMLFNFGGNTGMGGGMDSLAHDVIAAQNGASHMKGVSISPEGGDTNPALYALMAEMTWRCETPDMEQWVSDYVKRRYGLESYGQAGAELESAWSTLHETVYSQFVSGDGPSQTLVNAAPKLSGAISRVYGSNSKPYETQELIPAWKSMLDAARKIKEPNEQFLYDLVDVTRQVLGDISGEVYTNIKPNFDKKNKEATMKYADLMVQICEDLDEILATNRYFMIGTRLADAKGRGVTEADQDFYEQVERTFLTYWILDNPDSGSLADYCNRHLAGLMTDYYGMRWQRFADGLESALEEGLDASGFNNKTQKEINADILKTVEAWSKDHTPYPTEETGDAVEISRMLYEKYQPLIQELYGAADDSRDIPTEGMSASAGSQQAAAGKEGPASNVLDGDTETMWHTSWNGTERDVQYITIDLGGTYLVDGLRYLPRQGGGVNGIITGYRIEVSNDGGKTFHEASAGKWEENTSWKIASFEAEEATHVKLCTVDAASTDNRKFASAAEIRIMEAAEKETVDKDDLQQKYEELKHTDNDGYTTETWNAFQEALLKAKEAIDNPDASQEDVDGALNKLIDAFDHLEKEAGEIPEPDPEPDPDPEPGPDPGPEPDPEPGPNPDPEPGPDPGPNPNPEPVPEPSQGTDIGWEAGSIDRGTLSNLYKEASAYAASDYTAESFAAFEAARRYAGAVLEKENVSQYEVDWAQMDLQAKMDELVKGDSAALGTSPATGDPAAFALTFTAAGTGIFILAAYAVIRARKKEKED